jgi:hypothetical protein
VTGLAEDSVFASFMQFFSTGGTVGDSPYIGIGLDTTTSMNVTGSLFNTTGANGITNTVTTTQSYNSLLGAHFVQAMERSNASTATFYGAITSYSFSAVLRM